jgi:hypothetical protein
VDENEADMKKLHLLPLTSIVAMILSVMAAQIALAQNISGTNRGTQGNNGQTGSSNNQGGSPGAGSPVGGLTAAQQGFFHRRPGPI